jgi:predicted alpha/beta-fold hydrolase
MNYVAPCLVAWRQPPDYLACALFQAVFGPPPQYRRERWTTPDGDFIDVDLLVSAGPVDSIGEPVSDKPLMVMFTVSKVPRAVITLKHLPTFCQERGMAFAVAHFRGCSGELNHGPRAYHSGDFEEIDWILRRFRHQHAGPLSRWASRWAATH